MAQQNTSAPVSPAIGEVQAISGRVVAVGADGSERQLVVGDPIFADDLIKTIGQSTIVVTLNDGTRFDLGRDAEALMDEAVYTDDVAALRVAAQTDIAEIQRAIAAGADPTAVTEAPAAGGENTGLEESVQGAVGVERTGRIGLVEAGFETNSAGQDFNPLLADAIDFGVGGASGAPAVFVPPPNQVPNAAPDAIETDEDAPVSGDVSLNDSGLGDGPVVFFVQTGDEPRNGSVSMNPDGTFTYTPNDDFNGTDTFVYTVTDDDGETSTAEVTVTVNPINDTPNALADTATTDEDTPVNGDVSGNDTGLGDGPVVFSVDAGDEPANGTVLMNPDGTYTYTPNADFNGTDTFTYTVTDDDGQTSTATVTVSVRQINDTPFANDDSVSTPEDTAVNGDVSSNDTGLGDAPVVFSVAAGDGPANGAVAMGDDGAFTYTPNANFSGTDSFVYTVTDGDGETSTATVNVTVAGVNDIPLAVDDDVVTDEDVAVGGDVSGNDSGLGDGPIVFSVETGDEPANGTVLMNADGTFTYTPNADFNGNDTFVYTVTDANGETSTAEVTVTVNPINDVPAAVADTATTDEDTAVDGDVSGNDTGLGDGPVVFSIAVGDEPANGTVLMNADGTFTYTPNADFNGTDTFTYTVTDDDGETSTAEVTVTVAPINDTPVAVADSATTDEDTAVNGDVSGNDAGLGDAPVVFSIAAGDEPSNGTVLMNADGTFTYTPNADFNGSDTFTYTVTDDDGESSTAEVTVTVNPINDVPAAVADTATTDEDTVVNGDVSGNDAGLGDAPVVFSVAAGDESSNGTVLMNADGTFTYTPNADFNGTDTFTYTVTDDDGETSTAEVTVTVAPINDTPVAVADSATTDEDTAVAGDVSGNDTGLGDAPVVFSVEPGDEPSNGTVLMNADGTFTYTPNADFNGTDTFTYTVTDDDGETSTAEVTVTVAPVNDTPAAVADTATTDEDTAVNGDVSGNDTGLGDGPIVFSVESGDEPANGTVLMNADGTFTYTPDADFNGTDTFTYTVTDDDGESSTAEVTVTVNPINDVPAAVADTATTDEDTPVNGDVSGNDTGLGDGPVVFSVDAGDEPANGTVLMNPDGTYTYTPNADFNGTDTFTYTVTDDDGETSTAEVTVTVSPVVVTGSPPDAVNDPDSAPYSVTLGAFGNSGWSNADSLGSSTTITPLKADGTAGSLYTNGYQLGVNGSPRTDTSQVPVQIEFDRTTNTSESITLEFAGNMNEAVFSVDRLFSTENGGEQGVWVALFDGVEIARDSFVLTTGIAGSFAIDTGALMFNQVRFESIDTVSGTGDGSDYLLTGFQGSGPATANTDYTVAADDVLTISVVSNDHLLNNDSDPDGDSLTVISIDGSVVGNGDTVSLSSGAELTISDDGSFVYDPNGAFDGLAAGAVATDSFDYTITDGNGNSDTATAIITTIGVSIDPAAAAVASLLINDTLPTIDGGAGDNILSGSPGAEAFTWEHGDRGGFNDPAIDTISKFNLSEGDALDIGDLLVGNTSDLTDYLRFEQDGQDAVMHISTNGRFDSGYVASAEDQRIVLENVDLNTLGSTDQQIIDGLLAGNNLIAS